MKKPVMVVELDRAEITVRLFEAVMGLTPTDETLSYAERYAELRRDHGIWRAFECGAQAMLDYFEQQMIAGGGHPVDTKEMTKQ